MEMDVNRQAQRNGADLMTISGRCYANNNATTTTPSGADLSVATAVTSSTSSAPPNGCCGILSRLFCITLRRCSHKPTHVAGSEFNNTLIEQPPTYAVCLETNSKLQQQQQRTTPLSQQRRRRTPQEIYFESRGKSCKKLLKFNGNSNKILLYPEEGWARTASSSYWTITPCWWQPNRCRIVECAGTQRQATKAKMLPLEQQGSLLIAGHFRRPAAAASKLPHDEFKLYLTSNISMEDYNMGYCLTGFVERRCQQTNTFQMTHFAVIKRQWPPSNLGDSKCT
ncbi:uncharacterized protein LOC115624947 [Scaptodrosophila lebanonensis]|uniref:Uncharacterized protein LOC115624947 n=1 Tax=Drosophila lebanonensis TaxID=7225 RepID=A0A6J2TKI6_DROLE|nr:uncharacterized protein LOC115624947 [Scaptodrosophila lebanonensis]